MKDEGLMFPRENRLRLKPNGYKEICKLVDERDGNKCVICGSAWNIHHHHCRFRSAYGSDTIDNLVDVCARCHDVYCHGSKKKRWAETLKDYLSSEKCTIFSKIHDKEIKNIYKRYAK